MSTDSMVEAPRHRGNTRRCRKSPPPTPPQLPARDYVEERRQRFIKEGEVLYDYMIHNFESMFDGDSLIKHFNLRSYCYCDYDTDELLETHSTDLQKELIPWIRMEFENKELFKKENWKPFRDSAILSDFFLGYRKFFKYKQYYVQLSLDDYCGLFFDDMCSYCKNEIKHGVHFEVTIWDDDIKHEKSQKQDCTENSLSNNHISEYVWEIIK